MKHQNKNSYDYYVKCTCIRFMIYTIAKTWREHKIWVHIKHEWSQILYMYDNSLIIMTYGIMNIKTRHAMNDLKACKHNGSKRLLPKPIGHIPCLQNKVVLPPNSPWKWCIQIVPFKHRTHPPQGTITLTSWESPHLHQIQ